jgi:ATP-dependent Clp protease ATP-binding subunit ClpB
VKRIIQHLVLNELSKQILRATVDRTRPVVIDAEGDGLRFKN